MTTVGASPTALAHPDAALALTRSSSSATRRSDDRCSSKRESETDERAGSRSRRESGRLVLLLARTRAATRLGSRPAFDVARVRPAAMMHG